MPPPLEPDEIVRHHRNAGSRKLTRHARGPLQRIGATVRRPRDENSDFVARLLTYLQEVSFAAAPRYLGVDDRARDIFTYVAGRTTNHPSQRSEACYSAMGRLLRRLHDLTAGTLLAGTAECVIHGDASPGNTVLKDGLPVALIDWDLARPAARIEEAARAAWLWCLQTIGNVPLEDQLRRLRQFRDAYGAGEADVLLRSIIELQRRCKDQAEAKLMSARTADEWDLSHLRTIGWATIEREHVERNAEAILGALQ